MPCEFCIMNSPENRQPAYNHTLISCRIVSSLVKDYHHCNMAEARFPQLGYTPIYNIHLLITPILKRLAKHLGYAMNQRIQRLRQLCLDYYQTVRRSFIMNFIFIPFYVSPTEPEPEPVQTMELIEQPITPVETLQIMEVEAEVEETGIEDNGSMPELMEIEETDNEDNGSMPELMEMEETDNDSMPELVNIERSERVQRFLNSVRVNLSEELREQRPFHLYRPSYIQQGNNAIPFDVHGQNQQGNHTLPIDVHGMIGGFAYEERQQPPQPRVNLQFKEKGLLKSSEDEALKTTCCICMETDTYINTNCGHKFCNCILHHLSKNGVSCPMCRQKVFELNYEDEEHLDTTVKMLPMLPTPLQKLFLVQ